MKIKNIRILTLMLVLLMVISSFTACSNKTKPASAEPSKNVLLCGFESTKEMLTMNLSYLHAKVEIVNNKKYVTDGKCAAKFTIKGDIKENNNGEALYYVDNEIYFFPGTAYMKKTDFSDVVKYSIDIYNANDYSLNVIFGYNHPRMSTDNFLFGRRTLKANKMNHLEFEVDNEIVDNFVDVTGIKNFFVVVEGRNIEDETTELYFDNFRAELGEKKQAEGEFTGVIDFSNKADVHKFGEFGSVSSVMYRPEFTLNKDLNYISTGRASMKIEFHRDKLDTKVDCTGFRIMDNMLNGFQVDVYSKSYLQYELYNATDYIISVQMSVYDSLNNNYTVTTSIAPHSWSGKEGTSICLQDLQEVFLGDGLDIWTVGFTISGLQNEGDCLYLDHLSIVTKE